MKTIRKHIKSITLILTTLIILQSCIAYKSVPITSEEATKKNEKVKVITKSSEKFEFKRISFEDGAYFGIKKSKGEIKKTLLNKNMIEEIKIKDKTASTILSIVFPVTIIGVGILVFANSYQWKSGTIDLSID